MNKAGSAVERVAHLPLGPGAEFDRIRSIWNSLGEVAGPSGDDCAFLDLPKMCLAVSNDLTVENTHFFPGWLTLEEIGWRAAMAAFSDLAAVAAQPIGIQLGIGASIELHNSAVSEVMEGVGAAAKTVGAKVWGGDLVQCEHLVIDATVFGDVDGKPVRRSGAKPGDVLVVTGLLGGPAAALDAWLDGEEPDESARARFAKPEARIAEALWLKGRGAHAMIDISDGLVADASHLASASGVSCVIELKKIPVHPSAAGSQDAAQSGEEYELLVVMPPEELGAILAGFAADFDVPLTVIGGIQVGSGVQVFDNGDPVRGLATFQHF